MSNNDRFIEVQDRNGTHHIGTSVEYVTMPDGTFLSDNLGNLNVMQKGSVEDRLNGLENNQYAPITNPQFLEGLSVITQNNNTAFKVAEVNDKWQTKIGGQLLINGAYNKGIIITPPASSNGNNVLNTNNGLQIQIDSTPVLNLTSSNIDFPRGLHSTGTIYASRIQLGSNTVLTENIIKSAQTPNCFYADNKTTLNAIMNSHYSGNAPDKLHFLTTSASLASYLIGAEYTDTNTRRYTGFGFCNFLSNTEMRYFFFMDQKIYLATIFNGKLNTDDLLQGKRIVTNATW